MPTIMEHATEFQPCNLCESTSAEILSLKDRSGDYLRTVICRRCGLIRVDPRPDDDSVRDFYSKSYRREYKGIVKPKRKHVYRDGRSAMRRYRFFRDILREGDSVLDMGAGTGVFVYCLRMLGIDASGIEPDRDHSRYAREELKVPVKTGFSHDVTERESFQLVTLHHVLEHTVDPLGELRHIRSLLCKDGFLVVEVPSAEDTRQDPMNRYHKAHLYTFNPETLIALGAKAGFVPVRKHISPLNGNIALLFQRREDGGDPSFEVPADNFEKLKAILQRHSNGRFYLSSIPYLKRIRHTVDVIREQIAIMGEPDERALIHRIVSAETEGNHRR